MVKRNCTAFLGTTPEVIDQMGYGGTRYKYLHGVFIDYLASKTGRADAFLVSQAGRPSVKLGTARTLNAAKRLACLRAKGWED